MSDKTTSTTGNVIMLNNKPIKLHQFTGKVIAYKESSRPGFEAIPLSTTGGTRLVTRTKDELFLVNDKGVERSFSLHDAVMPSYREGHVMQIIWATSDSITSGLYVVVNNVTLNEAYLQDKNIHKMTYDLSKRRYLFFGLEALAIFLFLYSIIVMNNSDARDNAVMFMFLIPVVVFYIKNRELKIWIADLTAFIRTKIIR